MVRFFTMIGALVVAAFFVLFAYMIWSSLHKKIATLVKERDKEREDLENLKRDIHVMEVRLQNIEDIVVSAEYQTEKKFKAMN